ncbi:hypothetical protein CORC01_09210 [Colletotrichum orchidophilum]|uniref:Uncharacterized protein n=1 Tax=Colletotrichum orchidophilum TaxID=1209926 RepID=A0A1G4B280_9PEZI|nr:uncharacterized protein CORC01_09210 [Colletotrichum orchidophilum]OHE95477.1 hypothetical protein CORC01_09210 [Colletotrichum orchidophilum]
MEAQSCSALQYLPGHQASCPLQASPCRLAATYWCPGRPCQSVDSFGNCGFKNLSLQDYLGRDDGDSQSPWQLNCPHSSPRLCQYRERIFILSRGEGAL